MDLHNFQQFLLLGGHTATRDISIQWYRPTRARFAGDKLAFHIVSFHTYVSVDEIGLALKFILIVSQY